MLFGSIGMYELQMINAEKSQELYNYILSVNGFTEDNKQYDGCYAKYSYPTQMEIDENKNFNENYNQTDGIKITKLLMSKSQYLGDCSNLSEYQESMK